MAVPWIAIIQGAIEAGKAVKEAGKGRINEDEGYYIYSRPGFGKAIAAAPGGFAKGFSQGMNPMGGMMGGMGGAQQAPASPDAGVPYSKRASMAGAGGGSNMFLN